MMQGLYSSASGMISHQDGLGIVGNNLANVNTVGFKQQLLLFDNLGNEHKFGGANYDLEVREIGFGSTLGTVRTLFSEGSLTATDNMTELAIGGKGFFQVSDGNDVFYTRAGNFHFDNTGTMITPSGHSLTGIAINEFGEEVGGLVPINVGANNAELWTSPPKATTEIEASMNLFNTQNKFDDEENPYFSMLQSWNGENKNPLEGAESIALNFYDSAGVRQNLQVYFDQVTSVNGEATYEYVIGMDPTLDGRAGYAGTESAGMLMSGTMTFSSAGELINLNSFSPTGEDLRDPASWTLSQLNDEGLPTINLAVVGQEAQNITLNLGAKASSPQWVTRSGAAIGAITAADIGADPTAIPNMSLPIYSSNQTTALQTSTSLKNISQDGYPKGDLSTLSFNGEGVLSASYTNGQSSELFRVPVFNFTSEDGLRREGDNLYAHTEDAGNVFHGVAGTENFGTIYSQHLEQSNVDVAREMVNMIVVQRGFQSNSKSLQTVDTMIQKAIELKR